MTRLMLFVCAVSAAVAAGGCTGTARRPADPPPSSVAKEGTITINGALLSSIKVAAASERESEDALSLAGRVQFDEDRVARIIPPIAGQIVGLRVKVGDRVAAGDKLCDVNSREAAGAAAEYIESRTALDLAEKQAAITRDLYEHDAASKIALQQAENDLGKAQARVARTAEELNVLGLAFEKDVSRFNGRLPIPSPISGLVVERRVTEGQFVQPDPSPILIVANLDGVWVMGDVFERDLRFVARGQRAEVIATAYPDEGFGGRVDYISESIDPATRTAKVRVAVANLRGRLKPEMFVTVRLQIARGATALAVPAAAVFNEEGRNYVYVELGAGRFKKRAIEVSQDHGEERRVVSGLQRGDRVVVDGVLLLRQEERQQAG